MVAQGRDDVKLIVATASDRGNTVVSTVNLLIKFILSLLLAKMISFYFRNITFAVNQFADLSPEEFHSSVLMTPQYPVNMKTWSDHK